MDGRTELSESCVHASNFKNYEGVTHEELRILSVNSPINDPGVHGEDINAHGILQTRSKAGPSTSIQSATLNIQRKIGEKKEQHRNEVMSMSILLEAPSTAAKYVNSIEWTVGESRDF